MLLVSSLITKLGPLGSKRDIKKERAKMKNTLSIPVIRDALSMARPLATAPSALWLRDATLAAPDAAIELAMARGLQRGVWGEK